jgi:hypothetical protein
VLQSKAVKIQSAHPLSVTELGGEPPFPPEPGNGRRAPIPAVRGTEIEPPGSTLSGRSLRVTTSTGRDRWPGTASGGISGRPACRRRARHEKVRRGISPGRPFSRHARYSQLLRDSSRAGPASCPAVAAIDHAGLTDALSNDIARRWDRRRRGQARPGSAGALSRARAIGKPIRRQPKPPVAVIGEHSSLSD